MPRLQFRQQKLKKWILKLNKQLNKRTPIFNKIPKSIFLLSAFQVLIELVLYLGDYQFRVLTIELFGFNPTLFYNGDPIYFGQRLLMFASHTCIHLNFFHLSMNMVFFLGLGSKIAKNYNENIAFGIFFFSAIMGALFYSLLSSSKVPMIGASGGVFGYLGFWKTMEFFYRRKYNLSIKPILIFVLVFTVINIVFNLVLQGSLAWEAHLGGFLGGCLCALPLKSKSVF